MRKCNNFIIENIDTEFIAVPVGPKATIFHGIVILNEPVVLLLQAMQDKSLSKEDMISILIDHYLVNPETVSADLDLLIHNLTEMGLIET